MAIDSWFTHEKNGDFPVRYVSLPEGRMRISTNQDWQIPLSHLKIGWSCNF